MELTRRRLLAGFGAGIAGTFLGPAVSRLIAEARAETAAQRLLVFTCGNGFGHQGMERNSELLDTRRASSTDWDMPEVLSSLEPFKDVVNICRPFRNPHGANLHGNGWGTLNAVRTISGGPGGVSVDRWIAQEVGTEDAFSSVALGIATHRGKAPPCTSSDGPRQPFPAIGSPLDAHAALFGGGVSSGDVKKTLAANRSLLDELTRDTAAAAKKLGAPEREKFEQLTESYRALERRLSEQQRIFSDNPPPERPADELDKTGLHKDVIRAQSELLVVALSFGLTKVGHLSILGHDAHNAGWGTIGVPGDAHENIMHVSLSDWSREDFDDAVKKILDFQASEVAYMYGRLQDFGLHDESLILWMNSGGGKHHHGNDWHPAIMVGSAGGKLETGRYEEYPFKERSVADLFLTIGRAYGKQDGTFGDPDLNSGELSELLA